MNYSLYENCVIDNQMMYIVVQFDGQFVVREPNKNEKLVGRFVVPINKKKRTKMERRVVHLIRKGKITIPKGYIITPRNTCIKANNKVIHQLQQGGFEVGENAIVRRRKRSLNDEGNQGPAQRQRVDDIDYDMNLFDLVNVQYRIYFIMYTSTKDIPRSKGGLLRNVLRSQVERMIEQEGDDFIARQNYETVITNMTFTVIDIPEAEIPLMEQRMYGTKINYHYLNVEANYSDDNSCVYQFLVNHYGKWIKSISKASLLAMFDEEEIDGGVSTYMVETFCRQYGVSLYSLNLDMKVFHKFIPKTRNHNIPPLVYVLGNAHMFPILDNTARKSIFAAERTKKSNYQFKSKVAKKLTEFNSDFPVVLNPTFDDILLLKDTNVIFTKKEDEQDCEMTSLLPLVIYFFQKEQTLYKTRSYNGNILQLQYKNNVNIQLNPDYRDSLFNCEKLNITFKNQSLTQLANEMLETYRQDTRLYSTFNENTKKVFYNYAKRAFIHTYYEPDKDAELKAFDIQKCFTACLTVKNPYPFCVYTILDEISDYSGTIRDGMYYVECENYFPLVGNGWYFRHRLEYAISLGIDLTIKFELIPSYTIKADYFNELKDLIYNNCLNAKHMLNSMIGSFNKRSNKASKDVFTADINDAIRYYFSDENAVYYQPEECPELYHIKSMSQHLLHQTLIPINYQVIDNSIVELHKLATKMGGRIVKLNTDSCVVQDGQDVECLDGIGNYRIEKIPEKYVVCNGFQNSYTFTLNPLPWNEWTVDGCNNYSRLISGLAGTGKTTKMKSNLGYLGRYVLLGTTNTAAELLGGQTVHHYFQIDINGKYDKNGVLVKANQMDYIIIDEFGMAQAYIYEILYYIKCKSRVKFILLGDFEQLSGVEKITYDYFKSTVLKELVDHNIERLTDNHRCPPNLFELFDKVDELTATDFGRCSETKVHLCMTNKKRIEVNEMMMKRDRLKKRKLLKIDKNPNDENSQDVYLLKGTPVMAIQGNKSKGFFNGSMFKVKELDPLILKHQTNKSEITIDVETFKTCFYVAYCRTVHKAQGQTIRHPFTIHQWSRMDRKLKYTAISRATSKENINVIDEDEEGSSDLEDTDFQKVKSKRKRMNRMKDELFRKRANSLAIINRIVRGSVSDEYCLKHTFKTKKELLEHLKIPNGVVFRGYDIDHIKPRREHSTDEDFVNINIWSNLKLIPRGDNNKKH